jgi:hypothetical protein
MTTQRRLAFGDSDLRQTPDCPLPIGSIVGAKRWPYSGNHVDCVDPTAYRNLGRTGETTR